MSSAKTPCAQTEQSAPLSHPQRVWDGDSWVEAMCVRRKSDGTFRRKIGNEPTAQLTLFEK
jgi:hypothetical protein